MPARETQLVLTQEGAGSSVPPPWAPSENLQVKSARRGGEHVQPEAGTVQVVGPRRGQVEGEHGAACCRGGVCDSSKADNFFPVPWSHAPRLEPSEGCGQRCRGWRMCYSWPAGQVQPLQNLLLGQLQDHSSFCLGCQGWAPTGGALRSCPSCPPQCPQQNQAELDIREPHAPGGWPQVRSLGWMLFCLLSLMSCGSRHKGHTYPWPRAGPPVFYCLGLRKAGSGRPDGELWSTLTVCVWQLSQGLFRPAAWGSLT